MSSYLHFFKVINNISTLTGIPENKYIYFMTACLRTVVVLPRTSKLFVRPIVRNRVGKSKFLQVKYQLF